MKSRFLLLQLFALASCLALFSGCSSKEDPIFPPNANFSFRILNCSSPYQVEFTNLSSDLNDPNTTVLWDFGDGNTSTAKHPIHVYTTLGFMRATLTVTNTIKGEGILRQSIDVSTETKPIISKFSYVSSSSENYAPSEFTFTNQSVYATNFIWEFGDKLNTVSTEESPKFTYTEPGTYTIKLKAICSGDTVESTQSVTVVPPPTTLTIRSVKLTDLNFSISFDDPEDTTPGLDIFFELYKNSAYVSKSLTINDISTLPVTWDQEVAIVFTASDKFVLSFKDDDFTSEDDLGDATFYFSDLIKTYPSSVSYDKDGLEVELELKWD